MTLVHKTSLGHVSALIGIESNERVDVLVKAATENPTIKFELPVPFSHVEQVLKNISCLVD